MENIHSQRIEQLREIMSLHGWDAVVLRGNDPHSSEFLCPRYRVVTWLSGFTGEAGDLVITADHAGLWTDSRYFIQAATQLQGTGVELHKTRLAQSVNIPQWLGAKVAERKILNIACDSLCESSSSMEQLRVECAPARITGIPNLIDELWTDRPGLPCSPIITMDEDLCGIPRLEKIEWLRGTLLDADFTLVSALDEIAWILNVRAQDIEYNPVAFSYLLVGRDSVQWFCRGTGEIDEDTAASFETLRSDGIDIEPYDAVSDELKRLLLQGSRIVYDPQTTSGFFAEMLSDSAAASEIPLKKAIKTRPEIEGMREAHLEDGLAVEKLLYWLECRMREGRVSEWEASCKLHEFRSQIPGFRGESFETISAWGPAAALPHYSTPSDGSTFIEPHGLYLCDSGGQYLFGTTDITRTVPCGELTREQMEDYTIVLKGMIDLSMAVFPYGTAGCQIDALAREPLWRSGRDFGHGTGHGVGFFLCVHEGPQSIRQNFLSQPLLPGMITSDEPAVYREGSHGVRHENLLLCREAFTNGFGRFLRFETLTCCHFDTRAILPHLLSEEEKSWLNAYNAKVYSNFASAIEDEDFLEWLHIRTLPIQ